VELVVRIRGFNKSGTPHTSLKKDTCTRTR
jgi:hypothetical protein